MSAWHLYLDFMDQLFMPVYRWPAEPILGFYLGTAVLALICVVVGEFSLSVAFLLDHKRIQAMTGEVVRMHNLSIQALQAGDGESYRACNKLANEAFGKMFFRQVALSMSSLWPLPFALAWLQYRFFNVEFPLPLLEFSLGYIGVFIIIGLKI